MLPVPKRHLHFTPEFLKTDYDCTYEELLKTTQMSRTDSESNYSMH